MPRYFPVPGPVRRIVETVVEYVEVPVGGDGAPDARTFARLAARVRVVADLLLPTPARVAAAVRQGPLELVAAVRAGIDAVVAVTGTVPTTTSTASAVTTSTSGTPAVDDASGGTALGTLTVDYARTAGATSAVQATVNGRNDWSNVGNAVGAPDGSDATIAGSTLGPRGGRIVAGFADFAGKDAVPITRTAARFHVSQSGTVLNNGDLTVAASYTDSVAGTVSASRTYTANVARGAYDLELDPPTVASDLDTFVATVTFASSPLETYSATCDAVELVVEGQLVEEPAP